VVECAATPKVMRRLHVGIGVAACHASAPLHWVGSDGFSGEVRCVCAVVRDLQAGEQITSCARCRWFAINGIWE
jgi:hypothetical protein